MHSRRDSPARGGPPRRRQDALIDDFLVAKRARGASEHILSGYLAARESFARWYEETTGQQIEPDTARSLDAAEFRRHLQGSLKPSSVNTRLRQVKAVFAWAAESGAIERDPLCELRLLPEDDAPVRTLDRRTMAALLREAQRGGGAREAALYTLLAQTGLRIAEALALTWNDLTIRERSGFVTVRRGKGGKRCTVPLTLTARTARRDAEQKAGEVVARCDEERRRTMTRRGSLRSLEDMEHAWDADPEMREAYRREVPYAEVARAIIALRVRHGLSQTEFAAKVGRPQSHSHGLSLASRTWKSELCWPWPRRSVSTSTLSSILRLPPRRRTSSGVTCGL